jgi:hypothetical protein
VRVPAAEVGVDRDAAQQQGDDGGDSDDGDRAGDRRGAQAAGEGGAGGVEKCRACLGGQVGGGVDGTAEGVLRRVEGVGRDAPTRGEA